MNKKHTLALLLVSLLIALAPTRGAAGQVYPQAQERPAYVLLQSSPRPSPDGAFPVLRLADPNSGTAQKAARLLERQSLALALHQYVKNYRAHQSGDPALAAEPTYVFLGGEGGYAELGFWLEDAAGQLIDKRATSFVGGMQVDQGRWGDFEQIFPHELGHAMLHELSGWPQGMLAAQVHQVTLVTDYVYAFDEGWGEHFQALAVDHTANASLLALREQEPTVGQRGPYASLARELEGRCLLCPAQLSLLMWHSQREQHLRYAGVKTNLLAHQATVPQALLERDDPRAALLYQAIVPPEQTDPLKNGPQMLACEGVLAALFYRLVNEPRLQQSYREPAFYEPFLPPGQRVDWTQTAPQELFSPLENVYLKLFAVLVRRVRLDGDPLGQPPTMTLLRGYAADYADEADALYDVFLEITQGVTVSAQEQGRDLDDLRQRLLDGRAALDSALAPPIWLRNADVQVGVAVMDVYQSAPRPYHFDLNAATVADLRTIPGIDVELARQIVRLRDEQGGVASLDDLAGLSPHRPSVPLGEIVERLRGMQDEMRAWLEHGGSNPEDEISTGKLLWSLLQRLLMGLALASVVAGLTLTGGKALQAASARRLGLPAPPARERAVGRARKLVGRAAWVIFAVLLPVTLFFLAHVLLIANDPGHVLGLVFAVAWWLLSVLPRLAWGVLRRRLGRRAALHRAAWGMVVYTATFIVLGWLMGV